jgi:hypothetical protein
LSKMLRIQIRNTGLYWPKCEYGGGGGEEKRE